MRKHWVLHLPGHSDKPTATELGKELGLDGGHLSRILQGFRKRGLIANRVWETDGRQSHLSLT